ncbi:MULTISPECIES: hypothetical protein [unclassified Brevibacterium]|uniref:hypothetical protein n=1 Tax=unclassified Brevibacterium TaxID=2614124 RepID=UPI0010F529FC|nr:MULTISPECIES: hypothetical protein [unclassified Brevibacterium]MCM1013637.1 hypothetical protein [Brevibacterium sp. XM4083]
MRLPDIPQRHRLLVRAVSTLGSGAQSIVRRRDFTAGQEPVVRAAYAVATAALTWLGGTKAFADQDSAFADEDTAFGRLGVDDEDSEAWTVEATTWKSQAVLNAAAAIAAGAASWALWTPIQDIKDRWDAKLPAGVGRGLNAAVNSTVMAVSAFALDKAEEFVAAEALDGHTDFAPVEIELPPHIQASVEAILDQPHPQSQDVAEVVRAQLEHARFFVWVPYSTKQFPGSDPIELSDEDLAALLAEEDISSIDVYLDSDAPAAVPATQTYPVVGVVEAGEALTGAADDEPTALELSLEISDGLLARIELLAAEDGEDLVLAAETAERLGASAPGTLHPDGVEAYPDTLDDEDVDVAFDDAPEPPPLTLADWPRPADLTFRTDRS